MLFLISLRRLLSHCTAGRCSSRTTRVRRSRSTCAQRRRVWRALGARRFAASTSSSRGWGSSSAAASARNVMNNCCQSSPAPTITTRRTPPAARSICSDSVELCPHCLPVAHPTVLALHAAPPRSNVSSANMQQHQLDPKLYSWYLDLRRFGTVPHASVQCCTAAPPEGFDARLSVLVWPRVAGCWASDMRRGDVAVLTDPAHHLRFCFILFCSGFGVGFERLLRYVTSMGNIRDLIPVPRTPGPAGGQF